MADVYLRFAQCPTASSLTLFIFFKSEMGKEKEKESPVRGPKGPDVDTLCEKNPEGHRSLLLFKIKRKFKPHVINLIIKNKVVIQLSVIC